MDKDNDIFDEKNNFENDTEDEDEEEDEIETFDSMNLDQRLLHAIADIGWSKPTLIQAKTIPLALKGHDILARARTGTGKTGAFIIPILEKILSKKKFKNKQILIFALILAPSKELCNQIEKNFHELIKYCRREITVMDISQYYDDNLLQIPDILIGTPKKIVEYIFIERKLLNFENLQFIVIDESDLMFSFGYQQDLLKIFQFLPNTSQHFLMSATLNVDVNEMKKLILNKPIILKLEEPDLIDNDSTLLQQYHIEVFDDEEKFVLMNALLKLNLIIGKTIVFVDSVDRCYRLRLFLEQFGIQTCVLNSELPILSRCTIIEQFNQGKYEIIIASDEQCLSDPSQRKNLKNSNNIESSVARGIDFRFVSNVVNFDFPTTVDSYVHRIGRTVRLNNFSNDINGNVLSFILPDQQKYFQRIQRRFNQRNNQQCIKPYQFRMDELEAFRYRSRDALRSITKLVIRNVRAKEIHRELLQSKLLQKKFFNENFKDLKFIQFDRSKIQSSLKQSQQRQHLKHLPDYIIPKTLQTISKTKRNDKIIEQQAMLQYHQPSKKKKKKFIKKSQSNDPLKTFRLNQIKRYKQKKRQKSRK